MADATEHPADPAAAPGPLVFISHSSQDREAVEREIVPFLHEHSIRTWYAGDDIRPGHEWERKIVDGLERCDWFMLVMSPRSAESKWVKDELHLALDRCPDRVIPFLLEPCDLKQFHIRVPRLQYVDFANQGDDAWEKFLDVVAGRVALEQPGDHDSAHSGGAIPGKHGRRRRHAPQMLLGVALAAVLLLTIGLALALWPKREPEPQIGLDEGLAEVARPVAKLLKEHGHTSVGTGFVSPRMVVSLSALDLNNDFLGKNFINDRLRVAFYRFGIATAGAGKVNLGGNYEIAWREDQQVWRMTFTGELTSLGDRTPLADWSSDASEQPSHEQKAVQRDGVIPVQVDAGTLKADFALSERDIAEIYGVTVELDPSSTLSERVGLLSESRKPTSHLVEDGMALNGGAGSPTSLQVLVDGKPQKFKRFANAAFYIGPANQRFTIRVRNNRPFSIALWVSAMGYHLFEAGTLPEDLNESPQPFHVIAPGEYLDIPGFVGGEDTGFRVLGRPEPFKSYLPLYQLPTFTCVVAAAWPEGGTTPPREPSDPAPVLRTTREPLAPANVPDQKYHTGVLRTVISFRVDDFESGGRELFGKDPPAGLAEDPNNPFGPPLNPADSTIGDPNADPPKAKSPFLPPMPPPGDVEAPPDAK